MGEELKLLSMWGCPFCRIVELALKLKGVHYEYIEEDLSNKSDYLVEHNPIHKKVPVLIHNGKAIAESIVILEYIEETWTHNPLLPQQPYDRAMARFWVKFIEENVVVLINKIAKGKQGEKEEASKKFEGLITFLECELKGKSYFGGQGIGMVDIIAILIPFWLMRAQEAMGIKPISDHKYPEIYRWIRQLLEVNVVCDCIPPKDMYMRLIMSLGNENKANP